MKEEFRQIFEFLKNLVEGLLSLSDWLKDAISVFPKSCGTIIRWIGEIIAYFDRRTTQGVVEGINNQLKLIKRKAYGFRNFDNFILRSFLHWHFASKFYILGSVAPEIQAVKLTNCLPPSYLDQCFTITHNSLP